MCISKSAIVDIKVYYFFNIFCFCVCENNKHIYSTGKIVSIWYYLQSCCFLIAFVYMVKIVLYNIVLKTNRKIIIILMCKRKRDGLKGLYSSSYTKSKWITLLLYLFFCWQQLVYSILISLKLEYHTLRVVLVLFISND